MIKMNLNISTPMLVTERWKQKVHSDSFSAKWGDIRLTCTRIFGNRREWVGGANLNLTHRRVGPIRTSIKLAKKDAQRLAVEVLRNIRDGTKALMDKYEMGEDD